MPDNDPHYPRPPGTCACGCGEPVHGSSTYAGATDTEQGKHRARAHRERIAADKRQAREDRLRAEALAELGLGSADLPELVASMDALIRSVGHVVAAVSERASACEEATVEQRLKSAREEDRSALAGLRVELSSVTDRLRQARAENRRLQLVAADADRHAAVVSEMAETHQQRLEEQTIALEQAVAQRDADRERRAAVELENEQLLQLVQQQTAVIAARSGADALSAPVDGGPATRR